MVVDYQVGRTTGVLFLRYTLNKNKMVISTLIDVTSSLRYHRLHPEYVHQRIQKLGHSYTLRILLVMCDVVSRVYGTIRTAKVVIKIHDHIERTSRTDTRTHKGILRQLHYC